MKANPKEGAMKRYLILMFALAFGLCATSVHAGRVNPAATQRDLTVPLAPLLLYPADGDSVLNGEALRWELPPDSEWAGTFDIYIDGILVSENLVDTDMASVAWHSEITPGMWSPETPLAPRLLPKRAASASSREWR